MGSTPVRGSENSFSEYFDLRTLLHYLHFIQVTNPFINFLHDWPKSTSLIAQFAIHYHSKFEPGSAPIEGLARNWQSCEEEFASLDFSLPLPSIFPSLQVVGWTLRCRENLERVVVNASYFFHSPEINPLAKRLPRMHSVSLGTVSPEQWHWLTLVTQCLLETEVCSPRLVSFNPWARTYAPFLTRRRDQLHKLPWPLWK